MHKFWNFSQSGVASDPVFVHNSITEKFRVEFQKQVKRQHGVHPRTNFQVAPTMRFSGSNKGGVVELNQLKVDGEKPLAEDELKQKKPKADIDEPLMQDDQGSSLVSLVAFASADEVVAELWKSKCSGLHYYGATGASTRKLLEERLRSAYFIVNDSPLQQCNVFAPLGNGRACGLGTLKGFDGTSH